MGYYGRQRGDYYGRGDYYRGDPGFFSSLGKIVGSVARVGVNLLPGPVGAVARTVVNTISQPRSGVAPIAAEMVNVGGGSNLPVLRPVGSPVSWNDYGAGGLVQPTGPAFSAAPGGAVVGPQGQVVMGTSAGVSLCTTKGYHLNKSGYFRRTPNGGVAYIEARSACVKNRRMNPTNGTALKRALRRAYAFKKVAMRTIRLVDAGRKPKKFGGFKTRKRSS